MSPITQAKRMSPITQEKMVPEPGHQCKEPRPHTWSGFLIYIGLNQWQHSGTSQIHSRQVTANTTVETAVVEAPSLT